MLVIAIFIVIIQFLSVSIGISIPLSLITSNSMEPTLMEGDIVAWTPTDINDVKINDIVIFKSYTKWPNEKLIVHRIKDIKRDDKTFSLMLETKGDANKWEDQNWPYLKSPYIKNDHIIGKVILIGEQPLKIPYIGNFGVFIWSGLNWLVQHKVLTGIYNIISVLPILFVSVVLLFVFNPEKIKIYKEKLLFSNIGF
jgi:signal peptidase I